MMIIDACAAAIEKNQSNDMAALRTISNAIAAKLWNCPRPPVAGLFDREIQGDGKARAVPVRVFVPSNAQNGSILFLHGGGWAFGSPISYDRLMREIAIGTGLPVVFVDYGLAPENQFPAPLENCVTAWRGLPTLLTSLALEGGPTIVAGDSAGANLALALMLHELSEARSVPAGGCLIYGCFDDDTGRPSYLAFDDRYGLSREAMNYYFDCYAPSPKQRESWLFAPLRAPDHLLGRLPRLSLFAAGNDVLLSDTLELSARLSALSRDHQLSVYPGLIHAFMVMSAYSRRAADGVAEVCASCLSLRARALISEHDHSGSPC